jgi:phage antirepressor YoqD-like protein
MEARKNEVQVLERVVIEGVDLPIIEYKGIRVVTAAMVDRVHGRPEGTARKTYNAHRDKFLPGEDCFVCNTDEAKELGITAPNGVLLFTESGYLLVIKPFTDDLSWRVQRQMVKAYFTLRALAANIQTAATDVRLPDFPEFGDKLSAMREWIKVEEARQVAVRALAASEEERSALATAVTVMAEEVEVLKPKAEVHDQIADADGLHSVAEAAKVLETGELKLFTWMRENKIIFRNEAGNNVPFQKHLDAKHFKVVEKSWEKKDGKRKLYQKIFVTGKGLVYLAKRRAAAKITVVPNANEDDGGQDESDTN